MGGAYTYYSWTLGAKEHMEWLESQKLASPKWRTGWFRNYSECYALWSMRLISPILALMGISLIVFMLLSIIKFLLR
jgi:hypothetical protein